MAPPKRAKFTKMDTVFTEGSMECLSKRLVVDFDDEIAAQETIDACVHLAFAHVKSRIQEEMAVSFAVVSLEESRQTQDDRCQDPIQRELERSGTQHESRGTRTTPRGAAQQLQQSCSSAQQKHQKTPQTCQSRDDN